MLKEDRPDRRSGRLKCLGDPLFWSVLAGFLAAATLLGILFVTAVENHDAFLRLRPLVCAEGMANRQFFTVAVASPLCVLFTVLAAGEMWERLDARRRGFPARWRYFWAFLAVAAGSGAFILLALDC